MPTYKISTEIYLDKRNECYKKILTISPDPNDNSIKYIIKKISRTKLSEFEGFCPCDTKPACFNAILNPDNTSEFLNVENVEQLIDVLILNAYTVDYNLSKLLLKTSTRNSNLICYVKK